MSNTWLLTWDGSATLLASEPAETTFIISSCRILPRRSTPGAGCTPSAALLPSLPRANAQTVLLFTFFFKSFLYISIFCLFEHQETLSLWFGWLFFLFCLFIFVGMGILRQGLIAKNDLGLLLFLPLPPEQRNVTVSHHALFMWYMGQNSGLSTF